MKFTSVSAPWRFRSSLPIGYEERFEGVVDLITMKAIYWNEADLGLTFDTKEVPVELRAQCESMRERLVAAAAEASDEMTEKYLAGIRTHDTQKSEAVCAGAPSRTRSFRRCAVPPSETKVCRRCSTQSSTIFPRPPRFEPIEGVLADGVTLGRRESCDDAPFAGLAFKIANDPVVGTLTFFRVYSGVLGCGDTVFNPAKQKQERIGRMVQMHSNDRNEITEVRAGDIAAAIGLHDVTTGDTLCDANHVISLERMEFPEPVISVAVEARSAQDRESMSIALGKLAHEDPSFRVHIDDETGQTIIEGMGELHLEIIVDRMRREFGVDANVGKPRVAYRETVRERVEIEGKFARQSGGRGQFGHVWLRVEPLNDSYEGRTDEFVNGITDGRIPREYVPAVADGVKQQMLSGVLAGHPLINVRVTLFDGSFHEVDSTEVAFRIAGSMALKAGVSKAKPALLEPIMKVEVVTPEDNLGDVIGDLNRRRGTIESIDQSPAGKIVRAEVPMAEMFGYSTNVRSATKGRATYAMEFSRYQIVPDGIAEGIVKKRIVLD